MPTRDHPDRVNPEAVTAAVTGSEAILHLATGIPPLDQPHDRQAYSANDRLRTHAVRILVMPASRSAYRHATRERHGRRRRRVARRAATPRERYGVVVSPRRRRRAMTTGRRASFAA
jgi:hypothetical protein